MDRSVSSPSVPKTARLAESLCFAVYSANLAFNRAYRPLLDRMGLTYVQYVTLLALWEEDGIGLGRLGDRLYLASNTLTPVVKRLEAMGLVRRSRDLGDERQVRVTLTEAGNAMRAQAVGVPGCLQEAAGLTAADMDRLVDTITALRGALLGPDGGTGTPA